MNTKTFAQTARRILMDGVAQKLLYWGFTPEGEVMEEPVSVSGGYSFRGEVFDDATLPTLWKKLRTAIRKKGMEVIVEEAAYTWFNRMMALRIMAKNDYEEAQLSYVEGMEHTPIILQRARQGEYSFLNTTEQERLRNSIGDYNKDTETFALLLVGYCHNHQMLNNVFGKLDDYTELLLPDNILQESGFLHLLNTTNAISDDDYQKVELIGWLYQFYISERKDEVFASFKKNKKAEAKDIPAATQIFTPNWIVKYMVENTAGKLWLDKNPDSPLREQMKYLVENTSSLSGVEGAGNKPYAERSRSIITDIEQLTLIDPAAGSGHILVEAFDLIYQMYMEEYYEPEEAVESILKNNLYGLDIDDRAAQLATFAILLKAAKKYRDVFSKGWMPNMYAMPEAKNFSYEEIRDFLGDDGADYADDMAKALHIMRDAKNLGSVMKLKLSDDAQEYIAQRFAELERMEYRDINIESIYHDIKGYIPVLLILTKKYTSVVANPPYMGQKNMNAGLKNYVNANYPLSKSDLFAVFMEVGMDMSVKHGAMGMINQHSWMFLSSFEKLRSHVLKNYTIDSMLHLGPRTFEELSGEVVQSTAFILRNTLFDIQNTSLGATYYRLVDYKNVHLKEEKFTERSDEYSNILQSNFFKIPGSPIAYWLTRKIVNTFENPKIEEKAISEGQNITGNNEKFLKVFWEVNSNDVATKLNWELIAKGGSSRKWYGNIIDVVKWDDDTKEHYRKDKVARIQPKHLWFRPGVVWNLTGGSKPAFRLLPKDYLFNKAAPTILFDDDDFNEIYFHVGLLNSTVSFYLLNVLNPTLSINIAEVLKIPMRKERVNEVITYVRDAILISKKDWDSRETSWDFEKTLLLNESTNLKLSYKNWQKYITKDFFQLHQNEEELNRIFINIYGLQDELTSDVALKDITILQQELDRKKLEADEAVLRDKGIGLRAKNEGLPLVPEGYTLPIDKSEVISQFISYAIGLFMGRYKLDKPGLNIAHPNPTEEELASYTYNNGKVIIDDDAILPLMGSNCNFPDDALQQITSLLDTIWGEDVRTENINFIQECLNKDLEKFLVKDFYKYHTSMYKKKPIYWLFSSKKGAFQVLVYMHRMNEFTAEKIRANYLLEHIKQLRAERDLLQSNESSLNTQEARRLEQLGKDISECEAYDMELHNIADQQIKFDLDDGVTANYKLFEKVVAKI